MKTVVQETQKPPAQRESGVRPLARMTARELTAEELTRIAGGGFLNSGISNCGAFGDHDLQN